MDEFCSKLEDLENTKLAVYESKIQRSTKTPEYVPMDPIINTPPSILTTPGCNI